MKIQYKNIFLKYIITNMLEKKSRLFLFVMSISVSVMLFVCCLGLVDVINDSFSKSFENTSEGMDVVISSKETEPFFEAEDLKLGNLKERISEICLSGIVEDDEIRVTNIRARKDEDIEKSTIIDNNLETLKDNECIISNRISNILGKNVNDTIDIAVNGEIIEFKISAISTNDNLFYSDTATNFTVIVSYEYVNKKYDLEDKINMMYLISDSVDEDVKAFNDLNKNFKAIKIRSDSLSSQYDSFFLAVYAMFGVVVLVSFMIIYGAFNLIISERMSTIGTFFSQGATRKDVKRVLYLESVGYGVIGGIVGTLLGVVVLYFVHINISPLAEYGVVEPFRMNPLYIMLGILFAIMLSWGSILIPVKKVDKLNVKDIILNNVHVSTNVPLYPFVIGCVLIVLTICYLLMDNKKIEGLSVIGLLLSIIGVVLITKKIVCVLSSVIVRVIKGKFKTIFLALNNLATSKVLLNNINIISISILAAILVNSTSMSLINVTTGAYEELDANIIISNIGGNDGVLNETTTENIIKELKNVSCVKQDTINPYIQAECKIDGISTSVLGICPDTALDYLDYLELGTAKNKIVFDEFKNNTSENIILSEMVLEKIGKKVGDRVEIELNDKKKEYTIVGEINGKMYFLGTFIFCDYTQMMEAFEIKDASVITLKVNKQETDSKEDIVQVLKKYGCTVTTRSEDLQTSNASNQMLINAFNIFIVVTFLISMIGIFNNIYIGFIQRKKETVLLESIGLSFLGRIKMILGESIFSGVWSIIIIVPYSKFVIIECLERFMKWAGMPISITLQSSSLLFIIGITMLSIVISCIPIIIKMKKVSIVEELKYE